nr:MAG TPA: hypothetical protein [Caudoviricetes sp.]
MKPQLNHQKGVLCWGAKTCPYQDSNPGLPAGEQPI